MADRNKNTSLNLSTGLENVNGDDTEVFNNQEEIQNGFDQLSLEIPSDSLFESLQNLNISADTNVTNSTSSTTPTTFSSIISRLSNIATHLLDGCPQLNVPFANISFPCLCDVTVPEPPDLRRVLGSIISTSAAIRSSERLRNELVPVTTPSLSVAAISNTETYLMQLSTVPSPNMPIPRFSLRNLRDSTSPTDTGLRMIYTMAPSQNLDTNLVVSSAKFSQRDTEILQPRSHVLTTENTNVVLLRPPSFIPLSQRAVPRMIKGSASRYGTAESQHEEKLTNVTEFRDMPVCQETECIQKSKELSVQLTELPKAKRIKKYRIRKKKCLKGIVRKPTKYIDSEDSSVTDSNPDCTKEILLVSLKVRDVSHRRLRKKRFYYHKFATENQEFSYEVSSDTCAENSISLSSSEEDMK